MTWETLKIGLTHDVHAGQLRPDLCENSDVGTVDHVGLEEVKVGDVLVAGFKSAHLLDVAQLQGDQLAVGVALSVDQSENAVAFFPAVVAGEPTGRFRKEEHSDGKKESWDDLESPGNAERGWIGAGGGAVANEGASVANVVHDQDSPGDGPLLGPDETTTLGWRRDLGDVDRDLRRFNADGKTVDDTANDEHANVLRCAAKN